MRTVPLVFGAAALILASLACTRSNVPVPVSEPEPTAAPTASPMPTTEPTAVPTEEPTVVPTPTLIPTPTPVFFTGDQIGNGEIILRIPAIGVEAPLERAEEVIGSSGPAFTRPGENPLWVPGWGAEIGNAGVALIYGHRQWGPVPKVFTDLDKLEIGDTISVTGGEETLNFAVTEAVVVDPQEFWPTFFRSDDAALMEGRVQLALLTCTPWGTDRQRLIVFAELVR